MSNAFARIQYRWNRTIRTKSNRVNLLPSFIKKKPVVLTWDKNHLVYVSDPIDSPCGRHSAQLLVDGEFYPCDDFTIAAGMFEVNIYSKDTSSDEDKHLIASVPSKKIEFILKRAKDEVPPCSKINVHKGSPSKVEVKPDVEEMKDKTEVLHSASNKLGNEGLFMKKKIESEIYSVATDQIKPVHEKIHSVTIEEIKNEKDQDDAFEADRKPLPVNVLNHSTSGDPRNKKIFSGREGVTSAFQPFPAAYFPLFPCIFSVDRAQRSDNSGMYQWSSEKITEIVTEDEEVEDDKSSVSSPRKYTKKSSEFESQADQLVASVEKTIDVISNDSEMKTSTERILEMELAGHHSSASITTIKLRDEAAQTNNACIESQQRADSAVQTGNSLDEAHPDDDKNATDQFTEENEDKFEFDQWEENESNDRLKTFDPQLVCDKLNRIIAQESDIECSVGDDAKDGSDENTSDKEMDSCSLSSIEEKSVEITFDSRSHYADHDRMDQKDRELEEYSENKHWKEKESLHRGQEKKDTHSEKMFSPIRSVKTSDMKKITEHYVQDDQKDSIETIRERVSERERQVRRLQQEIMLLEDSHRILYQEKAHLLKNTQSQIMNIEDKTHLMELNEDKQSLSEEVEALKSHVTEQEKTNANLEWEVQALRERLNSNDPAEVSQLIEEMRSLRDELTTLTKKNKDLYVEIVNLREENKQLKRLQNNHDTNDSWKQLENVNVDNNYSYSPQIPAESNNDLNQQEKSEVIESIKENNAFDSKDSPGIKEEVTTVKVVLKTPKKVLKSRHTSKLHTTKYSSSDSEGTEYQELPRESPTEKLSKPMSPCLAESTRIESVDDSLKDKHSCAVQTLITALDPGTGTILSSPRVHDSKQIKQQGIHRRKMQYRSPVKHSSVTEPSGIYSKKKGIDSQSSSSSTDSLLEEADSLIRESMEHLLEGVRDPGTTKSKVTRTKWSKKNVVQTGNSTFSVSSPHKDHGGSGDHVRTVSYHASFHGYGPFIPKTDSDLHEGYEVKFMHPRGGMSQGLVRYVGPLPDHHLGTYVGIELFQPIGDNNGFINGKQIFRCETNKGLFVPLRKIVLAWER